MAFDSSFSRDDALAAQPNYGAQANDDIWTRSHTTIDVEDNASDRSSRPSVTLWDEITPAPRAMFTASTTFDSFDDPPSKT